MFSPLDKLEAFRHTSTMKNEIDFQPTAAETFLLNIGTVFMLALGAVNASAIVIILQKVI